MEERLAIRKRVQGWYETEMQSFEGIKPPYIAEGVDEVHWMLYVVHLGKRFSGSARTQMIEDLRSGGIETAAYSHPLHQQFFYQRLGWARGQFPQCERIADRAIALPLHSHLQPDHVRFIVATMKDAATNVGAGAAIY